MDNVWNSKYKTRCRRLLAAAAAIAASALLLTGCGSIGDISEIPFLPEAIGYVWELIAPGTPAPWQETAGQESSAHETTAQENPAQPPTDQEISPPKPSGQESAAPTPDSAETDTQETESPETESPGTESSETSQFLSPADIPHFHDRFYLTSLSDEMLEDFLELYRGAMNFQVSIDLPEPVSQEEADILLSVLAYDCPEMFQIAHNKGYTAVTLHEMVHAIRLSYNMTREDYLQNRSKCMAVIRGILQECDLSDEAGTEKTVYDLLTDRITYSMEGTHCANAYGALVLNSAKCDGISLGMKWIMEEAGIRAILIAGGESADNAGHAWNCIRINGAWYDLDLTNDARAEDGPVRKMYPAFNVSRERISRLYPVSEKLLQNFRLPETSMGRSYHELRGSFLYAGDDIQSRLNTLLDRAVTEPSGPDDPPQDTSAGSGGIVLLQFESQEDFDTFMTHSEDFLRAWFNEKQRGGSFRLKALNEYLTVCLNVQFAE